MVIFNVHSLVFVTPRTFVTHVELGLGFSLDLIFSHFYSRYLALSGPVSNAYLLQPMYDWRCYGCNEWRFVDV
jgi:hypothetical protein